MGHGYEGRGPSATFFRPSHPFLDLFERQRLRRHAHAQRCIGVGRITGEARPGSASWRKSNKGYLQLGCLREAPNGVVTLFRTILGSLRTIQSRAPVPPTLSASCSSAGVSPQSQQLHLPLIDARPTLRVRSLLRLARWSLAGRVLHDTHVLVNAVESSWRLDQIRPSPPSFTSLGP